MRIVWEHALAYKCSVISQSSDWNSHYRIGCLSKEIHMHCQLGIRCFEVGEEGGRAACWLKEGIRETEVTQKDAFSLEMESLSTAMMTSMLNKLRHWHLRL